MNPLKSGPNFVKLVKQFDSPSVSAIALMGSYARGDAGVFSDVDLVRFTKTQEQLVPKDGTYLQKEFLIIVSSVRPQEVEQWFSLPEKVVNVIAGIKTAKPLLDRNNYFQKIQERALSFVWNASLEKKADRWVCEQMIGWIEEVHKGLEGIRTHHIGRLLNARYGCSFGLFQVMAVANRLLLEGDNAFYSEVIESIGGQSEWAKWGRRVFSIENEGQKGILLREQIIAGLRLYCETAKLLKTVLKEPEKTLIEETVRLINAQID